MRCSSGFARAPPSSATIAARAARSSGSRSANARSSSPIRLRSSRRPRDGSSKDQAWWRSQSSRALIFPLLSAAGVLRILSRPLPRAREGGTLVESEATMRPNPLVFVVCAVVAASCGKGTVTQPTSAASTDCTTRGQVTFVRDVLREWYYWYRDLRDADPAQFQSPEAYLAAVKKNPPDASFSYIMSKAASDAFYSDSQFIGFGFSYKRTAEAELRVAQSFPDSPAADAGLDRGDTFLSFNGRSVADLLRTGDLGTVLGPEQEGFAVDVT